MNKKLKGSLILMLMAFVWGTGFVAQSKGMDYIGANTFNGLRMLVGSLVLLPFALINRKKAKKIGDLSDKSLIKSAVICGIILCAASTIQTYGLAYTTAGKSGFVTAMYIIFVPIISIFIGKSISKRTIACALVALFGMYLLCMSGNNTSINFGDFLTLICAILFSLHIIVVDHYTNKVDAIAFSCIQFFTCGVINVVIMLIFEDFSFEIVKQCIPSILYSGIFACGIGYTLQPIGQRYAEPSVASIIMSLESVFALLAGIVILKEIPLLTEIIGCITMFAAIIAIQLPDDFFSFLKLQKGDKL